ncbi:MAG: circularly permuted type 2 ATP-grasp protein [Alphaproteobacteria bacterium]|nr:circularly permuted type 2 ATP-grasp protein [Alphaproteobacteria bacterium]
MTFLCDRDLLRSWGICENQIKILVDGIPETTVLDSARAEEFWARRRKLFFKPVAGYGGKAAYRGDKITRGVWQEILRNDYVAQTLVRPSTRNVLIDGEVQKMKVDIRNYTYDGTIQLTAARLYQGQITNMRTAGGGFAPAFATNLTRHCACAVAG